MKKIRESGILEAKDCNAVFSVSANLPVLSPRDAEQAYGLKMGKGAAYIEFDASEKEVTTIKNKITGAIEQTIAGNVILSLRNPAYFPRS